MLSQTKEQVEHLKHSLVADKGTADQELQSARAKLCRLTQDHENQIQLAESKLLRVCMPVQPEYKPETQVRIETVDFPGRSASLLAKQEELIAQLASQRSEMQV